MSNLLAVVVLGFFLGMRHATDPDHVIAVTTIVARHRRSGGAAMIGALWGVGHTLTIMIVGSGIILLGWVIPPRVGLSLELAVGVMLIILGFLSLSGAFQDVSESATAGGHEHSSVHAHPHPHGDYVHSHPLPRRARPRPARVWRGAPTATTRRCSTSTAPSWSTSSCRAR